MPNLKSLYMNRMLRWPHDCAAICISTIIKLNRRSIILTWKKKLAPQQKAEYKTEKREEMQNLFKKIDDGVKAVFESESYKDCLRYMSKFTNYSAGNCILIMLQKPDAKEGIATSYLPRKIRFMAELQEFIRWKQWASMMLCSFFRIIRIRKKSLHTLS